MTCIDNYLNMGRFFITPTQVVRRKKCFKNRRRRSNIV